MQSFVYTIQDEIGIHARPAAMLAKEIKRFSSEVELEVNGKITDASRMIRVMQLDIHCGDQITVRVEGEDEADAVKAIMEFFSENL
ncbi:MAG: HPr family phosphocarrier protein [Clostridia bacterium]|nr:HPr family phosphocarrier protein [Clostridia bacterium]